ncbi:DUF882 domain-containing protein [Pseudoduganella sp. SL102]|uniref:Murein endopeptidase K n=1 Tax=Pseudoduganella albidiflava TaxID=321983 RepID=A0A411X0L2_9BURK|nr:MULTISPECIES: DUF882 domain-containing protein [Pseudoduganella]QBI02506.1 DUF882 domain-containing protein [Pseudoduganella albidiflava]WBS05021.1 DUF882 domain-containing protein [Pseudoduganella sp. SL102]GGY42227.1 hypothetical protein GCM10007387_25260 [Pseudoduganella albidiflava]
MNQRRSFLKKSVAVASALSMPALARAAVAAPHERILRFHNTHTGESLKSVFWAEGQFIPDALQDINKLLRDHRSNTIATIDPALLLLVEKVSAQFGSNNVVHIISGYRSPETNRKLAAASGGVARHSMHLEGKAIDLRIPGKDLKQVHKAALALKSGGVGYYHDSQFVHMDTGRVRHW